MQALNAAYIEALRRHDTSAALAPKTPAAPPDSPPNDASLRRRPRVQQDSASFVVDVAPVHAHEALMIAASSIGEVIVAASPDMIECLLDEPIRCWCRLDIAPEGETSSISLIVEQYDDEPAPDIDDVRDQWVASLNGLRP